MLIRKTSLSDVSFLVDLFEKARQYMVKQGNPHQWVGRPGINDIMEDIKESQAYVCEQNGQIVGTFAYIPGPDPTYATIYDGSWPDEEPYGVIHRLAGSKGNRGIAKCVFEWAFKQCDRIRIDTHEDNKKMQTLLIRNGFVFCGKIYLSDGSPRWAYFKHKEK